jgi:hypothetical protein
LNDLLLLFLELLNETLAAAIVVVAASLLLYNLTRNWTDRITRTSSALLATVTFAYIADVFVSLGPGPQVYSNVLRLQWVGIAFMPATMYHLSDALMATTGQPSRGRRRKAVRLLYIVGSVFLLLAAFTDLLIQPVPSDGMFSLRAKPLFPVYAAYFIIAVLAAFVNVGRARNRCLTRDTRRRMGYLQIALLTPALGIFPFSVLLGPGEEFSLVGLVLVNAANLIVILMLLFLAYPLSFFGSRIPDRVVKVELLRFLLRGPATGLLALVTIIFTTPATRILGLSGQDFMPFAVVAVVLLWQWVVALLLPQLERVLIYPGEDNDQLSRLQDLSERLLTRSDLIQLLEAILAAACDYLRVSTAFVIARAEHGDTPELVAVVGPARPTPDLLPENTFSTLFEAESLETPILQHWHTFWIAPLTRSHVGNSGGHTLIGFIGIQARSAEIDLTSDEQAMLATFTRRAEQTLDDLALQGEVFAALEGLLPQFNLDRARAADVEYRPPRAGAVPSSSPSIPLEIDQEQFIEQVKAALRHYWGGPGLSHSRLLELRIVHEALHHNDNNAPKALRAILQEAIERQKPDGERKLTSPEWTLYNILDMRFLHRQKVREVAARIALSEADFYRKQRIAIDTIANTLLEMEQEHTRSTS